MSQRWTVKYGASASAIGRQSSDDHGVPWQNTTSGPLPALLHRTRRPRQEKSSESTLEMLPERGVGAHGCRAALGYSPFDEDNAVDPLGPGSTICLQDLDDVKPLRHPMHVDCQSPESTWWTTPKRRGTGDGLCLRSSGSVCRLPGALHLGE